MKRIFVTGGSGFIGGELLKLAERRGVNFKNFDMYPPAKDESRSDWIQGDVRDSDALGNALRCFKPDTIVHLASDTDVRSNDPRDFTTTLEGTRNVLRHMAGETPAAHLIHASTQFVVRPGVRPEGDLDFLPYTPYGEAKAETERLVRSLGARMRWTILRPTIIWGPRHPAFGENIFKHISNRSYLHPKTSKGITRAFGYVENTAYQIMRIIEANRAEVDGKVFYLGDGSMSYDYWADEFSRGLTGLPARRIPISLLKVLGYAGDAVRLAGLNPPIDSGRVFRMSTSSVIDFGPIQEIAGLPPVNFTEGLRATIDWIRENNFRGAQTEVK